MAQEDGPSIEGFLYDVAYDIYQQYDISTFPPNPGRSFTFNDSYFGITFVYSPPYGQDAKNLLNRVDYTLDNGETSLTTYYNRQPLPLDLDAYVLPFVVAVGGYVVAHTAYGVDHPIRAAWEDLSTQLPPGK